MSEVCGDNRFEIIERAKASLIEATNIETSPKEMEVLDSLLFRFWQMGWLEERTCRDFGGEEGTNGEGYDFACSACGYCTDINEPNYCPNCGAKVEQ